MRAADDALIASTSCGFSWSAPRIVPTTWTSLRKPSGNDGRNGRSMRRQVRIAWSLALPSRRKNDPGILPAAYIRSSMSTVRGKKSVPSRTFRAAVAVASTTVSPMRATTAPSACPASLPVCRDRVRSVPLMGLDTVMASAMALLCDWGAPLASSQSACTGAVLVDRTRYSATGSWRRAAPLVLLRAAHAGEDGSDRRPMSTRNGLATGRS